MLKEKKMSFKMNDNIINQMFNAVNGSMFCHANLFPS